jgi:hypothetical protein
MTDEPADEQAVLARLHSLVEVLDKGNIRRTDGGDGPDRTIRYTVRHRTTGRRFVFVARDLYDFGPIVNPGYAVAPGESGGICRTAADGTLEWETTRRIRALDADEADCYRLVNAIHPFWP